MKKRLLEFLKYLKIGQTKFEENVGVSRGYIINLKDNITIRTIDKIKAAYPQLNTNWLITGEGDMIQNEYNVAEKTNSISSTNDVDKSDKKEIYLNEINILKSQLSFKDEQIEKLNREIGRLELLLEQNGIKY